MSIEKETAMRLHVECNSSSETVANLKILIEKFGGVEQVNCMAVDVRSLAQCVPELGSIWVPLVIIMNDGTELCAYTFTCGYNGTGPNDLIDIMNFCNMEFSENDIRSLEIVTDIFYKKH
ncbi:MAG: hypothetical protein HFJ45_09140 [Clostridia bacterium]|nr:hypothetical protein [Clostridia bacterium]